MAAGPPPINHLTLFFDQNNQMKAKPYNSDFMKFYLHHHKHFHLMEKDCQTDRKKVDNFIKNLKFITTIYNAYREMGHQLSTNPDNHYYLFSTLFKVHGRILALILRVVDPHVYNIAEHINIDEIRFAFWNYEIKLEQKILTCQGGNLGDGNVCTYSDHNESEDGGKSHNITLLQTIHYCRAHSVPYNCPTIPKKNWETLDEQFQAQYHVMGIQKSVDNGGGNVYYTGSMDDDPIDKILIHTIWNDTSKRAMYWIIYCQWFFFFSYIIYQKTDLVHFDSVIFQHCDYKSMLPYLFDGIVVNVSDLSVVGDDDDDEKDVAGIDKKLKIQICKKIIQNSSNKWLFVSFVDQGDIEAKFVGYTAAMEMDRIRRVSPVYVKTMMYDYFTELNRLCMSSNTSLKSTIGCNWKMFQRIIKT